MKEPLDSYNGNVLPPPQGRTFPYALRTYLSPYNSPEHKRAIDSFIDKNLSNECQVDAFLDRAADMVIDEDSSSDDTEEVGDGVLATADPLKG